MDVNATETHGEQAIMDETAPRIDIDEAAGRFRRGDEEAFREIVETMTRPLAAAAWRYAQDWDTARDLCQETWIRVWETIDRYDPGRSFAAWLFTIHRNNCLSWLRRASTRREVATDRPLRIVREHEGPDRRCERGEFVRRVLGAARTLPDRQREVFLAVDVEQRPRVEVETMLGMSEATLRTTLHNARKRVARLLGATEDRS